MRRTKSPSKKKRKFRLLLDAAFAKPQLFPKLSKKCNLAHTVHSLGLPPQALDEEIYQKAIQENRFVLTINYKDFKKLVKKGKPGIIAIESQLTNEQIDKLVADFLSDKDPEDYKGKTVKLNYGLAGKPI